MIHLKPMGTPGKCPAHERAWTPEEEELVISLYRKKKPDRNRRASACTRQISRRCCTQASIFT